MDSSGTRSLAIVPQQHMYCRLDQSVHRNTEHFQPLQVSLQESPSFLVPVGVLAIGGEEVLNQMSWKAKMLGCCFLVHYLHRALLYPLQTRPSKPTPLITSLLAYIFTALNGLLQVPYQH